MDKITKQGKKFGKNLVHSSGETMFRGYKGKNQPYDSPKGNGSKRRRGRNIFKLNEVNTTMLRYLIYNLSIVVRRNM